jgi:serine/threonine-protein kinase
MTAVPQRFVCPACGESRDAPGHCPRCGDALAVAADLMLGRAIGKYRLARVLGRGASGKVYLGVHPQIGSRVAIKVLLPRAVAQPSSVWRFENEARAASRIRHEGIVQVFDLLRTSDGRPCIVMEYLDGAPLAEHIQIRGVTMPLAQAGRVVSDTLDALGAAHAAGVIHRDLKPHNIYVTEGGRAKLLDFGVAKLRDVDAADSPRTATGALLGTPDYLAPEQATNSPVDHRSDLYAIGAILFECVTGTRPFVTDSLFELLHLHVTLPPPRASAFRPEIPAALDAVIDRALEKQPERRFDSAHAMDDALRRAVGLSRRRRRHPTPEPVVARESLPALAGRDLARRRGLGELFYQNGKLHGFWTYWDSAGNLAQVEEYAGGEVVRVIDFRDGKPIRERGPTSR